MTQLGNKRKRDSRSGDENGVDQDKPVTKKRDTQNKAPAKESISDSERGLHAQVMSRGLKAKAR
jgi:hypothetical protein